MKRLHGEIENKKVFAPDWDLYAYRWGQDSYTGNLNGNSGSIFFNSKVAPRIRNSNNCHGHTTIATPAGYPPSARHY